MDGALLIHNAEVDGRCVDLRCEGGVIVELARDIAPRPDEVKIDAGGGALLPGLHDHHIHLFSLAAAFASIPCGPPETESRDALAKALRSAAPLEGWLRGTGYFESVAGPLDRAQMDLLCDTHPLRIQHRSGAMWFLNTRAIEALDLESYDAPPGVERDATGRSTGRLFRADAWLRARLQSSSPPSLAAVGSFLARCGVTRLTDATPTNGNTEAALFRAAQVSGDLPQRLRLMGDLSLSSIDASDMFEIGEHKILLDEPSLPEFDELVARIRDAHRVDRCVAIHTGTRPEIHFAIAAMEAAGTRSGDRLEHASVAPPETLENVARLGISVVTQPGFVAERGDAYRIEVEGRDLSYLYRVQSWLEADIRLAASTDAPFGDPDPWRAIQAAVTRSTRSGEILGEAERVSPETALGLFRDDLSRATSGEIPSARLAVGQRADLCLLDLPWREARRDLSREHVVATVCAGKIIWPAPPLIPAP
jgi:predicted amidohydrolase YtcJ